ncbi:MAG TPA: hypothetical protein VJ835_07745 [Fimbriimonadaceae bacterium]|nr:hypothetical protein [Fimbriimonadaceae bacterium]
MRTLLFFLLLIGVAEAQVKVYLPDPAATPLIEVAVQPTSEVDGPRVKLGQIAKIKSTADTAERLADIDLGPAPMAGIPRPIVASRIQSALMGAGFKSKEFRVEVPTNATVALKVQKVELAKFVECASVAVSQIVGNQIRLTNKQHFPDFVAPIGEVSLEAGRPSKSSTGFSVLVSVSVDGKRVNSRQIQLEIEGGASISVAAGAPIKIYLRSAGATIEISGRTRTAGFVGQQITVTSSTGSVHQATVLSATEVEVKL